MTFKLTEKEMVKKCAWLKEHNTKCPFFDNINSPVSSAGAIGGTLTYSFTPNSLGTVLKVSCACGDSIDLTDYSEW